MELREVVTLTEGELKQAIVMFLNEQCNGIKANDNVSIIFKDGDEVKDCSFSEMEIHLQPVPLFTRPIETTEAINTGWEVV